MQREAKFQTLFNKYLRKRKLRGYFELKQTTSDSLPFDALEPHQKESLIAAEQEGLVWKFSDQDMRVKPFDSVCTPPMQAYVVVKYPEFFCIIQARIFISESERSERKSLTSERAKQLSISTVYN